MRTGLFLLSAAALVFEINLTRLFSVSQFYHFAFMVVSIALLGYGASGTALSILQGLHPLQPRRSLGWLGLAASLSILGSYLLINRLPFDSFSIAWDRNQLWILLLHYVALSLPFFFCGMATGLLLASDAPRSGQIYAINLLGSSLGCLLALLAPSYLGGEGTVVLGSGMAALAGVAASFQYPSSSGRELKPAGSGNSSQKVARLAGRLFLPGFAGLLLLMGLIDLGWRITGRPGFSWLALHLSPYKSLSYAMQAPEARLISQEWNAFSRVDFVRSPAIHAYPGLSYRYLKPLPEEDGLTVDGDDLSPVLRSTADLDFTGYLPAAVAFRLKPQAEALVIEPRGGLDLAVALAQGARRVTAVEMNPLIVSAAGQIYRDPRIRLEIESGRSYLRRTGDRFDIIILSLTSSFHPVRSGAYSLGEDYLYTVESFQDALSRLAPTGILVVTRWLQNPPSESLRAFAIAVTALERSHGDPRTQLVALRGYNTAFMLLKNSPFSVDELQIIRDFAGSRAFDFNHIPGMRPEEANRYNVLPEPIYSQAFADLLAARPRSDFYLRYPFDVSPPTDDHPFFGHYFKWSQAGQVLSEVGKIWQPFGGAGYFVVIALLILAVVVAVILIVLPAIFLPGLGKPGQDRKAALRPPAMRILIYFGLIGLAYILVEIPLIQRFILFLGNPAYAMTAVLFSLLLCSALGSRFSPRADSSLATGLLVILLLAAPWLLPRLFQVTLGLPLSLRLACTLVALAPAGFLMGIPFPGGIHRMLGEGHDATHIPWIWAVNGSASVVASMLAALLALSLGFDWVLRLGALCYALAWLAVRVGSREVPVPRLPR